MEPRSSRLVKIFSWNVNGIRAVCSKGFFSEFIEKYTPDIVCLQETKSTKEQFEEFCNKNLDSKQKDLLCEYSQIWNPAQKLGYSGTAIFSKIKPVSIELNMGSVLPKKYGLEVADDFGIPNAEGRVIALEFPKFFLVTVYTLNSKRDLLRLDTRENKWDKCFLEYCTNLQLKKPVIFCGDLNVAYQEIDLANPKQNEGSHGFTKQERDGFGNYLKAGFVDTFREINGNKPNCYTWWTHWANARARNVGWRIDYFLSSLTLVKSILNSTIHSEQLGSDHCPISIVVSV